MKKLYFIVGSQDLYGEECLKQVAEDSRQMVAFLNEKVGDLAEIELLPTVGLSRGGPYRDAGDPAPLAAWIDRPSLTGVGKGDHGDAAAGRSAGAGVGVVTHGMDRARREAAGPASFLFDAPSYSRFRGLVRRKGPGCKTALRAIRRAVKVLFQIRPRRSGRGPAAPGPCRGRR